MAMTARPWRIAHVDESTVERIATALDCHPAIARILAVREFDDPDTAGVAYGPTLDCCHDPTGLPDIDAALDRLSRALDWDETITVYGDRDLDGIAGTALLLTLFKDLGATVGYHIPRKFDGHGLHEEAIERIASRDTDLIVSVDCGTDDEAAIDRACTQGVDVIVTDHHPPSSELEVPFVNPRQSSSRYPNGALAGAGIALKLGQALLASRSITDDGFAAYAYPLAGIATVADRAPMTLENRAIVHAGYDRLADCPFDSLRAIADRCSLGSIRDLGWELSPLLNAAREATDGHLMIGTLFEREPERIDARIERLHTLREERQDRRREWIATLEREVTDQVDLRHDPILIVETDGYVGTGPLIDLSERTCRPVLCYYRRYDGTYRGSVVSAVDVDVRALVDAHEQRLLDQWGHPRVAGFEVAADRLEGVLVGITTLFEQRYEAGDLEPRIDIDCVLETHEIGRVLAELEPLRPFGPGYPEPIVLIEAVDAYGIERFGRGDRHIRLRTDTDAVSFIDWNGHALSDDPPTPLDVTGTIGWKQNTDRPEVAIEAVRPVADYPS